MVLPNASAYTPFTHDWFGSAPLDPRLAISAGRAIVVFLLAEVGTAVMRRAGARR